jgi:hypothetical protein
VKPGSWLTEQIVHSYGGQEDSVKVQILFSERICQWKELAHPHIPARLQGQPEVLGDHTDIAAQA